jgi:glycosyltransferase involved in cell wall biosynthesis
VRLLIFHGYLLGGTGSNVYNARLAAALVMMGHEVHLLCQDRHPEEQPFVGAFGDWDGGELRVHGRREEARCTVYRPDIGGLLPVYVADRYEGIEARTFAQCSDEEVERYIEANVAAVRELCDLARPGAALANHLVMGPVILARSLAGEVPYAVKVHGSALEYTVKPEPERFLPYAREGLAAARAVLVGSRHTAASLFAALGDEELPERTRLGPPGVDVERFSPRPRPRAVEGVSALAARLRAEDPHAEGDRSAFARDTRVAAAALERLELDRDRLVAFVGKLIVSKGVDLLLGAWPLVLEQVPRARLLVVGFGAYADTLRRLLVALAAGDLADAIEIARLGRALETTSLAPAPLEELLAFLGGLQGAERERYLAAASGLEQRVLFTGRLEHEELAELLPACEAMVVPSTFPESFGMVAAEAAACGALPISAAHSGLAEIGKVLVRAVPPAAAELLLFAVDDDPVRAIARRVVGWLQADARLRARVRTALVASVREHWSWEGVARGVIAAARGELERLEAP